jgi:VCBS repeat-containing protein
MKNVRSVLFGSFSVALLLLSTSILYAATPSGGSVSESSPTVNWTGGIMPANPDLLNSPRCAGANASKCDNFSLTVTPPSASFGPYVVEINLAPVGDWDVEVYGPDGAFLKSSGNGTGAPEFVLLDAPAAGTYRVAAFPFTPAADSNLNSYTANAQLKHKAPAVPATGTENVAYGNYPCPATQTCTNGFGEPSIGVNWKTGAVMFAGGGSLKTFRINFDDHVSPAAATWTNVGVNQHIATSPRAYADPILFTDPRTGRTFAGQLEGLTPFCTTEYTDDDGGLWIPSQGSGIAAGIDHETYGGGPLAPPLTRDPSLPAYPNGMYYCAQSTQGPAQCAISLDGGTTFGPSVPMWTTECGGLHGHIKVSPYDGTAYVPNKSCTGRQSFAVSTDNGATWAIRSVPGSAGGDSDPSIGIGSDGTVYFGFCDGDGHPKIAVTHDKGLTWDTFPNGEKFTDVGTPFGIQNSVFASVVAGDPDRAAFAFHGTPTAGPFQDASFNGVWDLYVAQTFDGGRTWTTVKASPDPVQRGCIWLAGGSNACRNLLDFFDAAVDANGRVVVGYADGCTGQCATDPNNSAKSVWATIARQSSGKRMFAQFDPPPQNPAGSLQFSTTSYSTNEGAAATITVSRVGGSLGAVSVNYATSNGTATAGADYSAASGTVAWADGDTAPKTFTVSTTDDAIVEGSETVNLTLTNPVGASLGSPANAVLTIIDNDTESACSTPGVTLQTDPAADQNLGPNANTQLDIRSVSIAEPYVNDTEHSLTFTMKVDNLSGTLQPNSIWTVYFNAPDSSGTSRQFFVQMNTSDLPTQANFAYGWHDAVNNIDLGSCFANSCGQISGSYTAEGTITIKLLTTSSLAFSDISGNPAFDATLSSPGTVLSAVQGSTSLLVGAAGTGSIQPADETDGGGSYTIAGNLSCKPSPLASRYNVIAPATSTPGTAFNVTVKASDANNAIATGYRGTVHFTSSDASSALPANYTFTAADAGVHVFAVTLNTSGSQTVSAADVATASIAGSANVVVGNVLTPTTTTLSSSKNPSPSGQAVTFTATVSPSTATGSVTFKDGATTIGTGALSAGTATFTTSSLSVGTHSITASYAGDSNDAPSASAALAQTVTQSLAGTPRFDILMSPPGLGDGWGEPSIGVNWGSERVFSNSNGPIPNGGTLMSFGGFGGGASLTNLGATALRVTCSDCPSPANAVWEKTASLIAAGSPRVYGDPILYTDHDTGRTFISQLLGLTPLGSGTDFTDDDGRTIVPTVPSIPSGVDHQTIGGGPYHAPVPQGAAYKNALYYCSQDLVNSVPSNCSLSVDGGLTWGPPVPTVNSGTSCGGGIHGHVKVGPDGTVYVPHRFCSATGTLQGLAISNTNGLTWTSSQVPGTSSGNWDPSVAIGKDNAIYFGMDDSDRHPRIAASHDGGLTWSTPVDVGAAFNIQRTAFPAVVAGDAGRAAFAFLGTPTPGDDQTPTYNGEWHLYIATTFDGGQNWNTSDVTPTDPVQRGAICASGPSCTASLRNLLDFFDAVIDQEGRVVVGYTDGCVTAQCINGGPNDATAKNAIARQSGGKRMFAAFDPVEPSLPKAPAVTANLIGNKNRVTWSTPDHSGSPVTSYKLYRRAGTGAFNLLALVNANSYDDTGIAAGTEYSYRVTAVNAIGEGPYCGMATAVVPADSCHLPGLLALDDLNADGSDNDSPQNVPADGRVNIQRLYVAEPEVEAGASKLVFTLYVKPSTLTTAPPNSQWYIIWNRQVPDANFDRLYVAMKSDPLGAVSFEYGKFGVPTPIGAVPSTNTNQAVKVGDVDSGTYDAASGKIVITLSTSKAENIQKGQSLTALNARTFLGQPEQGLKSQSVASDITVNGIYTLAGNCVSNHAPVAANDSYVVAEDGVLSVAAPGVLANDTDADNNALTARLVSGTSHGTLTLNSDGSFTYTPSPNYNGVDGFTYKANDGSADSNVATVSITVTPVNDAPVAANDSYSTAEDTPLTVSAPGVLANDTDVDGDALSAVLVNGPAHGTLTLNANGSFTYSPASNYNGADSFTYKANDGSADSNVATVNITVTAVNDPPIANNDSYSTKVKTARSVAAPGVLANDGDVDSASLTAKLVSGTSHGTLTLNSDGSFVYTPVSTFKGVDTFTYTANDGQANSNVATVSITVDTSGQKVKLTGAGEVQVFNPDGTATFGFDVSRTADDAPPSGSLNYYNPGRNLTVQSNSITSLDVVGTKATFTGTCTKNGAPCTFTATAEDNGSPGKGNDRFTIAVSGEPVEGGSAPITSGNVQIK